MKNLLRVVLPLLLCLLCVMPQSLRADANATVLEAKDQELLAEMGAAMKEIQKKMLQNPDPLEQAAYQREVMDVMEAYAERFSPKTKAMVLVGIRVVNPLQQASIAYMEAAGPVMSQDWANACFATSTDEIDSVVVKVKSLIVKNSELTQKLEGMHAAAEKLLDEGGVSSVDKAAFLKGFDEKNLSQMGPIRAIRNLDARMYEQVLEFLGLMKAQWGHWSLGPNGVLVDIQWEDSEAGAKAAKIMTLIQELSERQEKARAVLSSRL